MADVVVVGGGPAGAACALTLSRAGLSVTILERQRFPRRKVCGEYLNGGAVAEIGALGLGARVAGLARPLRGLRLVPPGVEPLELAFPTPALACERALLDAMLLDAARDAGAVVVHGRAEDVLFADGRASGVRYRDEAGESCDVAANVVVGADGTGSLVARKLGLARTSRGVSRFAVGGHYSGFAPLREHVEMYVGGGAYFALNPLDGERTNVMVVVRDRDLAAWSGAIDDGVRGRAASLGRGHRSFDAAKRIGARVAVGPLAFDVAAASGAGALLIGDAAGFLNPFTGQGVFLALTSARRAANAILAASARPSHAQPAIAEYADARARDFALRKRLTRLVDVLIDVPFLARRVAERLRVRPQAGAVFLGALAGTISPERALATNVLAALVV